MTRRPSVSSADITKILTHDLREEAVRTSLAGYVHQDLRNIHNIVFPAETLYRIITEYVQLVSYDMLKHAQRLQAAGVRPRNWPKEEEG